MSSCSAASRREDPPSTRAITRMRMSAEYAFGMARPPDESMPPDSPIYRSLGILRFYSARTCSSSGSHRDRVASWRRSRWRAGGATQREQPRAPCAIRPPRPPASSGWPSIRRGTGGRWRAASEAREQQRVAAKAELAAERRRVNVDEIEGIIRDAILREREFYSEVVAHVLGEALGRLDQEIKEKRDALASDLRELRRDIAGVNSVLAEVRAADREPERVVDLPNPIGRRVN